ncbi:hypothetical protein GOP47_0022983 [Adiantum capillus-veneris]|uniref:Uncharacterized protein n=1 Tax=Adiantum capillus-veneris TaxID=13818 RepID=A0A9D4U8E1_ADICA|nr:hypothetical protein GOP47_0022983 [Adiantum capillus-veneris]
MSTCTPAAKTASTPEDEGVAAQGCLAAAVPAHLADAFANPVAKSPAPTSQPLAVMDKNAPSVDTLGAAVHALVQANGHSVKHLADAPHKANQVLEAPYTFALSAAKSATFVASSGPRPKS